MIKILFITTLAVISFCDIKKKEIPNCSVLMIIVLSIVDVILIGKWDLSCRVIGMLCVSVPLFSVAVITKGAFGGGDIKLVAAGGFFLGWRLILSTAVIAFMAAGIYSAALLFIKRSARRNEIAFGPFLCVGMAVSLAVGERLIQWYLNLPL